MSEVIGSEMVEDKFQVTAQLKQMQLFQGLDDHEITQLAAQCAIYPLKVNERLFSQGDIGDSFYIILRGSVRVSWLRGQTQELLGVLVQGDYFGEEALLNNRRHPTSITATTPTILLRIDVKAFEALLQQYPQIKFRLTVATNSCQLARRRGYPWLGTGEVIYFIARKHEVLLITALVVPLLIALFSIPLFWLSYLADLVTPSIFGGAILVVALAWGIWRALDWGNDYYIVTNQRVVWLEKIIGLHDSRQEAPLRTILSVGVETGQLGRIIGFGDVIVRTYTGQVILRRVGHPEELAALIQEHWNRTKKSTHKAEEEAMVSAIRDRLGINPPKPTPRSAPLPTNQPNLATKTENSSALQSLISSFFNTRFVDGSVITYRKHWFLLLGRLWWQSLALPILIYFMVARLLGSYDFTSQRTVLIVGIALFVVVGGYWVYEFADWRNDSFQVSEGHIVDLDRKPLSKEERKSAPLENILSLEHERVGIIGVLLNFGNVSARVGSSTFTFDGVADPAQVQQDIFLKMDARIRLKRAAEAARERERMSAWLAAYHSNADEFEPEK